MNPSILYENNHLLIVNKPSGLVVHSDGKTIEPTLCDWIIGKYPNIKGVGEPSRLPTGELVDRPGIVHRLDRETSGALVVAKTQEAFEFLKKQFKDRNIHKIYNVFVWGLVKEDKGSINRPIGRSKSDFRRWSAERFARGELRDAITEYKVLKRLDFDENPNTNQKNIKHEIPKRFTFLEVFPKTGRTHQIRVHFKAINHPVVGDKLYAPRHPSVLGFERVALHARRIEFLDIDGQKIDIEAALPKDFESALNSFTN